MSADPPRRRSPASEAGGGSGGGSAGRNLPAAIASGAGLATLFLVAVYVEALFALALVAVLIGIALHELDTVMRANGLRPATPVVGGAALVMLFGSYLHGPAALTIGLTLAVVGTAMWVLVVAHLDAARPGGPAGDAGAGEVEAVDAPQGPHEADAGGPRRGPSQAAGPASTVRPSADFGASLLLACWVPLLAAFVGLLLDRPGGEWYLLAAIALPVSNDIGAYAFGNRLGRHKLAPTVSPAKTWEGFAGGLVTVLVLAVAVTARGPDLTVGIAVVIGVAVVVTATIGDLTESLVKRDLGVKDLGSVIPGHGGVMDRVDGILFALPTTHVALSLFGL